jgi:hypothetical protein
MLNDTLLSTMTVYSHHVGTWRDDKREKGIVVPGFLEKHCPFHLKPDEYSSPYFCCPVL